MVFLNFKSLFRKKNFFLWGKNRFFKNMALGVILMTNCNDIHESKIFLN